jgi:hypothetical protein
MDRQHIHDTQVIERYLQGKLSAADEEAFEEAYMADPALLGELKLAERLREGFRGLPEEDRALRSPPRARWLEIASSPRYGIAASLVAAAALLSSGVMYLQDSGFGALGAGQFASASNTRVLPLVTVRGAGNPNSIAAPSADEWTVLLLDTGLGEYDRYRAVLTRAGGGEELLRLDGMTPTYEGMVALGFPGRLLPPGDYEIRLDGGKSDWPAARALDELSRTPLTVTPRP